MAAACGFMLPRVTHIGQLSEMSA